MNFQRIILFLIMISPTLLLSQEEQVKLNWRKLSSIPDKIGFAGAYVAVANDCLVMMGGANFPDGKAPWDGGKKIWTDKIFMLEKKDGNWVEAGILPAPMGYGAVASYRGAIYIAGGSNEVEHLSKTYKLILDNKHFSTEQLPDLPYPIANCVGVLVENYWYILGGIESPDSKSALNSCWRLDLDHTEKGWEVCPSIPGEGRMLSVVGDLNGEVFIASGVSLHNGEREYLRDAYVLDSENNSWKEIAELPESVAAAPNPAWFDEESGNLFIFGGDNGELASKDLRERHPGFSNRILCYQMHDGIWEYIQDKIAVPVSDKESKTWVPVTTGSAYWQGGVVLPSGEVRPGIRTAQVLFGSID